MEGGLSDIRMIWQDKFIAHQVVPAGQLLANPFNFRIHTKQQQAALSGSLDTLQWIAAVKVNTTTGHIVDGHLRVTLALRKGENTGVPVDYYELTEAEEAQALLSLDPIAAMAATDKEQMTALLEQVNSDDEQVQKYMAELAEREGVIPDLDNEISADTTKAGQYDKKKMPVNIGAILIFLSPDEQSGLSDNFGVYYEDGINDNDDIRALVKERIGDLADEIRAAISAN